MRVILTLAAFVLLTTFAPLSLFRGPDLPAVSRIAFEPVPLDAGHPAVRAAGRLRFLAGWRMRSNDPRFGGISALHVEGGEALAISDAGSLIRFGLPGGRRWLTVEPLRDGPGRADRKLDRDTEALAVHGGDAWIGFERLNSVWRYSRSGWRSEQGARPQAMRRWPSNGGSEAMLRLADGRFLVFSEAAPRRDGSTAVILFDGDPALPGTEAETLGYRAPEGFRITDAALLPDGRLLFLNRRFALFEGISAKLTLVRRPPLREGAVMAGEEIAHLAAPLVADNFEALSVTREGGRTIVWIASDDNFSALQRTLLLKFELVP